jgi:anti-sigma B factor antagonist
VGFFGEEVNLKEFEQVELHAKVKEKGGFPVIELKGEIDLSTSPYFKEKVYEVIESGKKDIIINLSGLDFMDSTGLGVLVAALKKATMEGGSIRLVCNKKSIIKVFTITGLDKVFSIYNNLRECLEA